MLMYPTRWAFLVIVLGISRWANNKIRLTSISLHGKPAALCKLCHWEGCSGNESRGRRRSALVWGSGISSFIFPWELFLQCKFLFLSQCPSENSSIWSFWTNLRGSLSVKELTTLEISSSHLIWHGHCFAFSPANFSTVYPQRLSTSFTAENLQTDRRGNESSYTRKRPPRR